METTITLRTRTLGWGYETQPTGHGTEIEIPRGPFYTGTFRQLMQTIQNERTFQSLRSGGTFVNTAWFLGGHRIVAVHVRDQWREAWSEKDAINEDNLREGLLVRTESRPGRPRLFHDSNQVRISATVPPQQADWLRAHGGSATLRSLIARAMDSGIS